jgi:hypothetical protein
MAIDRRKCLMILELPDTATPEEIRTAYRDLIKVWHPDRFQHDAKLEHRAQEKVKQINIAYDWLATHPETKEPPQAQEVPKSQPPANHPPSTKSDDPVPDKQPQKKGFGCGCLLPGIIMVIIAVSDMSSGVAGWDWHMSLGIGIALLVAGIIVGLRK